MESMDLSNLGVFYNRRTQQILLMFPSERFFQWFDDREDHDDCDYIGEFDDE